MAHRIPARYVRSGRRGTKAGDKGKKDEMKIRLGRHVHRCVAGESTY